MNSTIYINDEYDLSYIGSYFSIIFSLVLGFVLLFISICCCCVLPFCRSSKSKESDKQRFKIVNYINLHKKDVQEFTDIFDENIRTKSKLNSSLTKTKTDNKTNMCQKITSCFRRKSNSFPDLSLDPELNNLPIKESTYINYLYYVFDNMDITSSLIPKSHSETEPFDNLNAFIQTVVNSSKPSNTVILLGINSPGGYAYQFEQAYTQLMRLKNRGFKIVALVDGYCASGGYMLASACNEIVCSKYSTIGSVGVITSVWNCYDLLQKIGIVEKTLMTGSHKRTHPTYGEPINQSHIDKVNETLQDTLEVFKDMVKQGRNLNDEELAEILSAKVWYGYQALDKKLVDKISEPNEYIESILSELNTVFVVTNKEEKDSYLSRVTDMFSTKLISALIKYLNTDTQTIKLV